MGISLSVTQRSQNTARQDASARKDTSETRPPTNVSPERPAHASTVDVVTPKTRKCARTATLALAAEDCGPVPRTYAEENVTPTGPPTSLLSMDTTTNSDRAANTYWPRALRTVQWTSRLP